MHILITGAPGVGKTTLVRRVSEALKDFRPVGFYTAEIREKGGRQGFELVSLDGRKGLLSHVGIRSGFRVGRYGVDVGGFEDFLDSLRFFERTMNLVIIDEIGKMECFSEKFIRLLTELLDSTKTVIATISQKGGGVIAEIKKRDDVRLFEVTKANRDTLAAEIAGLTEKMLRREG